MAKLNFDFVNGNDGQLTSETGAVKYDHEIKERTNVMDLEYARRSINLSKKMVDKMAVEVEALKIVDDDSNVRGTAMVNQVNMLLKSIKQTVDNLIVEPNNYVKSVRNFAKPFNSKLDDLKRNLKQKIGDYGYHLELKRREEEKRAKEEIERRNKKLRDEAKKKGVDAPQLPKQQMPITKKTVTRSDAGSATTHMEWSYEVIDEQIIPREYVMPDHRQIKAAIKAGSRQIPGLRIFEKPKVFTRSM